MAEASGASGETILATTSHAGGCGQMALNDEGDAGDEGRLRADTYSILASLLSAPPTRDILDCLNHIQPAPQPAPNYADADSTDSGDLAQAWQQLRRAADQADLQSLNDEYHALFIGLGRGEVVPYGSWHLTGFLMEKPLSDLRDDLRSLGFEADDRQKDPEDHIAALCEVMALIIRAGDVDEARERAFFVHRVHPWAGEFFKELQAARAAQFYKAVGLLGQQFVELENQYLDMQAH